MKLTNLAASLFLLSTTACGAVVDPSDDPTPPGNDNNNDNDDGSYHEGPEGADLHVPETVAPPALLVDAPRAATTSGSLFAMTFASNARIENLVVAEERTRIDVIEQKIVTLRNEEVHLEIELPTPTGTYSRVLVTDAIQNGGSRADNPAPLCAFNNTWYFTPQCEDAPPTKGETPSTGPITTSTWKLTVVDDVSGAPIASCIPGGPNKLSCALPARASASYRIIASAYGFAELWNGTAGFGPFQMGVPFVGALAAQPEYMCWDFPNVGSSMYCGNYYEFRRFTAIDRARLDFDPIALKITANGRAEAMLATPALIWDAGNDDVPGSTY